MKSRNKVSLLAKVGCGCIATFVCFTAVEPANAIGISFSGDLDPSNWTLTNNTADGSVDTSGAPTSIVLTGGDSVGATFGGPAGTTNYTITSLVSETFTFDWAYNSSDGPGFDSFSILLNGAATQLADTNGATGTESFTVNPGDTFGFQIATTDNGLGPGIVTISAPTTTSVPFEFSPALGLLAVGGLFGGSSLYRKQKAKLLVSDIKAES